MQVCLRAALLKRDLSIWFLLMVSTSISFLWKITGQMFCEMQTPLLIKVWYSEVMESQT